MKKTAAAGGPVEGARKQAPARKEAPREKPAGRVAAASKKPKKA